MSFRATYYDEFDSRYRLAVPAACQDDLLRILYGYENQEDMYIPRPISRIAWFVSTGDATMLSDSECLRRFLKKPNPPLLPDTEIIQDLGALEDMYAPNSFGEYFARVRKKAGLSQKQVTKLSRLSHSSIARYESGENFPTIATIHKLWSLWPRSDNSIVTSFADLQRWYFISKFGPEYGTIGELLTRERLYANLSVKELAAKVGFLARDIRRIERNAFFPLPFMFQGIARELHSPRLAALAKSEAYNLLERRQYDYKKQLELLNIYTRGTNPTAWAVMNRKRFNFFGD